MVFYSLEKIVSELSFTSPTLCHNHWCSIIYFSTSFLQFSSNFRFLPYNADLGRLTCLKSPYLTEWETEVSDGVKGSLLSELSYLTQVGLHIVMAMRFYSFFAEIFLTWTASDVAFQSVLKHFIVYLALLNCVDILVLSVLSLLCQCANFVSTCNLTIIIHVHIWHLHIWHTFNKWLKSFKTQDVFWYIP